METVFVFLADGFEEIEALATVDVLRRAGLDVKTVSVTKKEMVKGAHGVLVAADLLFEKGEFSKALALVLPGGMPGAETLKSHQGLAELLKSQDAQKKTIGAICAAPMVLGSLGLLKGRKATCYPGFEDQLKGAKATGNLVEKSDHIITGKGPGATFEFAFKLVETLKSKEIVGELKSGMCIE